MWAVQACLQNGPLNSHNSEDDISRVVRVHRPAATLYTSIGPIIVVELLVKQLSTAQKHWRVTGIRVM